MSLNRRNIDFKNQGEQTMLHNSEGVDDILLNDNLNFSINYGQEKISILNNDNEVGFIMPGIFRCEGVDTNTHLWVEIDEQYRGTGLGKKLFDLYDKEFGLPTEEYSRDLDKYYFFISIGYEPVSLINDITGEEKYFDEDKIEEIGETYVCKFEK